MCILARWGISVRPVLLSRAIWSRTTWHVLSDLIHEYKPQKLIFLGDLFHSDMNNDWDWFVLWRSQFPKLQIILIKGNHDIISDKHYTDLGITLHKELTMGPFLMLHHPLPDPEVKAEGGYVLCGHIHPGLAWLAGAGKALRCLVSPLVKTRLSCHHSVNSRVRLPS
jgi:metallophosphoesterase superfamily enzyme